MIHPLVCVVALIGMFAATASSSALRALSRNECAELMLRYRARFWYQRLFAIVSGVPGLDSLAFSLLIASLILRAFFVVSAAEILQEIAWQSTFPLSALFQHGSWLEGMLIAIALLLGYLFVGDLLPRVWAHIAPERALKIGSALVLPFLLLLLPLTALLLRISYLIFGKAKLHLLFESRVQSPERLLEAMEAAETAQGAPKLELSERKLLSSAVSFRSKVAREVMVPRIKMFALAEKTSIQAATKVCLEEGYSRIPLYAENLDQITGVLLVKELLKAIYQKGGIADLQAPVASLAKPVLFCPENKRISLLLQEFRARQVHLAIVVDEYGGTEGLLTIEDILEELVGEIGDEYDIDEEALFLAQPGGTWLVSAQMGILDIEDKLGIELPQSAEYDTLGGFIFHKTGTIPQPGYRIHCDACDLEIVSSSERRVERVRIRVANETLPGE